MSRPVHNRLRASLLREHFEEAAMLHEQRELWLDDPELSLADVTTLERRLEAHLDGLVLGGVEALPLCTKALTAGPAPELHVATRVLLRWGWTEILAALGDRLDAASLDERPGLESALHSALLLELAWDWSPWVVPLLTRPRLGPLLTDAAAQRGLAIGDAVLTIVESSAAEPDPRYVRALGRLRHAPAGVTLRGLLRLAGCPTTWSAAAIACLELGDRDVAAIVAGSEQLGDWSALARVYVSEPPAAWLNTRLQARPSAALLMAVAVRGDPSTLDSCVALLEHDELGELAAGALAMVTGTRLVHASGRAREDTDDELDTPVTRRCRSPERWTQWLTAHADALQPGVRYRVGRPYARASVLASLADFGIPRSLRELVRDELSIRHGQPAPPSTAALAGEQLAWLEAQR